MKGPLEQLPLWKQLGADKVLLSAIENGVYNPLWGVPNPNYPRKLPQEGQMIQTIGEYLQEGVVERLPEHVAARTSY